MNAARSTKNTTSALIAWRVISSPHDGPTDCTAPSSPSWLSAWPISWAFTGSLTGAWMRSTSPPTIWILASASPKGRRTSRASATLLPGAVTSHELPPSKSMPRLRPLKTSDSTDARIATAEMKRETRHWRGNVIDVSPW